MPPCRANAIRSAATSGDEGTTYFELIVRRGELELCRYSKHAGSERRIIPTQVTREVLLKLVGDVESALHGLETRSTVPRET